MNLLFSTSSGFLLFLLLLSLIIFVIIAYHKHILAGCTNHGHYVQGEVKEKQIQEPEKKQEGFGLYADLEILREDPKEVHVFIDRIMRGVTQFISYLDNRPLYKEDLDLIISNFVIWDIFLKQRARSRNNIILLPIEFSLDDLIGKLEATLALQSNEHPIPKLIIEYKDDQLPEKIICDINQLICLLSPVILSFSSLSTSKDDCVRIQFYTTCLKYELKGSCQDQATTEVHFPAIALSISHAAMSQEVKINPCYQDVTAGKASNWHSVVEKGSEWTKIEQRTIEQIVRTHYGYLQFPISPKSPMLIVVPCNAEAVRDKMIETIPPAHFFISSRELKDSIVVLKKAYDHLCTVADMRTIVLDELFLLIRRCYGFRRHASGQLFYVRALGIAQVVANWVPSQPRPVYFSLLYGLVCYGGLPLPYVKANYSKEAYCFIESILAMNKRQDMEPCGLYVGDRLKRIINREQLFVPCVKFAERLYDLRHAKDYTDLEEVKYMAKETLTIDIELGKKYLNAKIVEELVEAANQALQICQGIC